MHRFKSSLATCATIGSLLILISSSAAAAQKTLYSSSVNWNDESGKTALLATTPQWDEKTIKSSFDSYLHPERYQLAAIDDTNKYTVQFLQAFWGPLENPFLQYPRPAKAFIFLSKDANSTADTFFIAPLIKNASDGNYYVFTKDQIQPMLLEDWINAIKTAHSAETLHFNVCQGYGNLPTETCQGKSYQDEAYFYAKESVRASAVGESIISARRGFHEDWTTKIKPNGSQDVTATKTIYAKSINWDNESARQKLLNTVETWPDYKSIKDNFAKIRDLRYFQDEEKPDFMRRITWLYPDDGCWTRASAMIRDLFGPFENNANYFHRPSKVFAFGNLCANTANSSDGKVSWWYHTAPIVRDAQTNLTYVLDPSINPYEPLTVKKWMEAISARTNACTGSGANVKEFNICNGYGATPYDECQNATNINFATETNAMLEQSGFRFYERERQVSLNRDADKVLGDSPPWSDSAG